MLYMLQEADMTTCSKARSWEELKFFKISYPHYLCTAVMEKKYYRKISYVGEIKIIGGKIFHLIQRV